MMEAQLMMNWAEIEENWLYGPWLVTNAGDQTVRDLYDRHYSRNPKKIGHPQFCRPGRKLVLRTATGSATWVSWASKKRDDGYDAIENTLYRNESEYLISDLIKYAVFATICIWGPLPKDGLITYVHPDKVQSENPGYCYIKAGFKKIGKSKKGLWLYQIKPPANYLSMKELERIQWLKSYQREMKAALQSGEWMDAYEFFKCSLEELKIIHYLQHVMKRNKVKAYKTIDPLITYEEITRIISPYEGMFDDPEEISFSEGYIDRLTSKFNHLVCECQ